MIWKGMAQAWGLSTKISICQVLCNLSRQQTENFPCSINLLVHFELGHAYSSQGKSTSPSLLLVAAQLKIKIKTKIKSLMQSFLSCHTIIPLPKKWLLFEPHFFPNFGQSQLCSIFRNYLTPNYSFNYTVKSQLAFYLPRMVSTEYRLRMELLLVLSSAFISVLTCNNLTTSIHDKNWIWHSLNADYIYFPYLQFRFLCFKKTWPLK